MPTDKPDVMERFLKLNDQHRTTIELTMLEGLLLTRLVEASVLILAGRTPDRPLEWICRLGLINSGILIGLADKLDTLHKTTHQQFGEMVPDIIKEAIEELKDG